MEKMFLALKEKKRKELNVNQRISTQNKITQ